MKLIIAGSRDSMLKLEFSSAFIDTVIRTIFCLHVDEIVSGHSGIIDLAGEKYARSVMEKEPKLFPYRSEFGKAGGPIRNKEMALYADALLLIWDGKSRGSANMKIQMKKLNKPIYEVILKEDL